MHSWRSVRGQRGPEYTENSTKTSFHKNTERKREEKASPKPWCATSDVCDVQSETTDHAKTRAMSSHDPKAAPRATHSIPTAIELRLSLKPSLDGIERLRSVRGTEKVSTSRVVPTDGPSTVKRGSQPPTWRGCQGLLDEVW